MTLSAERVKPASANGLNGIRLTLAGLLFSSSTSSSADTIQHFQNRLRQRGLVATTRRTRGDDIDAACGQLAGQVKDRVQKRLGDKVIGDRSIKVASA